jgi:hypothetical protein
MTDGIDFIAEGLEQPPQKQLAAAAWKGSEPRFERQRCARKVRLALTATRKSRIEPARQHDREKRRGDVWTIVDVLVLSASFASATAHHADRVNVQSESRCAGILGCFGIEDGRVPERELPRTHLVWMLMKQEPEIRRGLVGSSDCQEHAES